MKISHRPFDPSGIMGLVFLSQKFESQIKLTFFAFGAHTAKDVPINSPLASR